MAESSQLRVQSLQISDIGCFEKIDLQFSSGFNLICGANGVGKSTILSIIARAFSHHPSQLRRRALSSTPGNWAASFLLGQSPIKASGLSEGLMPNQNDVPQSLLVNEGRSLFYFKADRDFFYSQLQAISRDPSVGIGEFSQAAITGIGQNDLKRWLANRFLFAVHQGSLSDIELANFEFAKRCFSILDPRVEFSSVEAATFDVFVNNPQGRVPFEYLSSGFRAALAMLLGIIREIEVRRLKMLAREFDGVILIDELDLHLHPTWQRLIVRALKDAFPRTQFIVTTHSPHMIQNAERGEVIALINDDEGNPRVANFELSEFGFKGWTIEEILQDVMGLWDVASDEYRVAMEKFDFALSRNDAKEIKIWLDKLEAMLHPRNHLRKLLRLQAAPFEEGGND